MQKPGWLSKSWLNKHKRSIVGRTALVAGVIGIIALLYQFSWTGFGPDSTKTTERNAAEKITKTIEVEQSGKTLWDWLSVLGVPLSLAILGFWFQQREQTRSNQQAELEKEIAAANQREEALQAYFDRLSTLLIDQNLIALARKLKKASSTEPEQQDQEVMLEQWELLNTSINVIRAGTLSILRRLGQDGGRKGSVIRFLFEAEVISKLGLSFNYTYFSYADLSYADLERAKFSNFDLNHAALSHANLSYAKLNSAKLHNADLSFAKVIGADLSYAYLDKTKLVGVDLSHADLKGAFFDGADLSYADLTTSKNCTEEQLRRAKLCKTKLPEGCNLDRDQDCQELEARVKGDR